LPASGPSVAEIERQTAEAPASEDGLSMSLVPVLNLKTAQRAGLSQDDPFDASLGVSGAGASLVIGEGDAVSVTIWESLSSGLTGGLFSIGVSDTSTGAAPAQIPTQIATASGIAIPFAGRVPVVGRSPLDVEADIVRRLHGKAINPQAIVTFVKPTSNLVSVIGDGVANNSIALAPGADRITDVIARAGAFSGPVDNLVVTLTRGSRLQTMPLARILKDPRLNIRMSPGDALTIEERPNAFVALGATDKSAKGEFGYNPYFLTDALADVGGVIDVRADREGVYVMRLVDPSLAESALGLSARPGASAHAVAYQFSFDRTETLFLANRFEMRDGDVLYVANSPYVEVQRLLDLFRIGVASAVSSQRAAGF